MSMDDFTCRTFVRGDITHRIFSKGGGPDIVLMHELPGMTPPCIAFARELADKEFTVHLPLLFGEPGDDKSIFFLPQLCISHEFRLFSTGGGSPIVSWLRALCNDLKEANGGHGIGVIGMCLTGNFAISLLADDAVLAPVASQPTLPVAVIPALQTDEARASLSVAPQDLHDALQRPDVPLMCLRFSQDRLSPHERYEHLGYLFGPRLQGIEIDSRPGNQYDIPNHAHSVLTQDFVDAAGHPTRLARDQVIAFMRSRLT